ncbi:hypothetical protein JXM67_13605 [candidate division WOR-3 bacterium]|nr:hypothetical protein [candidate division WOR-3 bacterium]
MKKKNILILAFVLIIVVVFPGFKVYSDYGPRVNKLLEKGIELYYAKDFRDAIERFKKALRIELECVDARIGSGLSMYYLFRDLDTTDFYEDSMALVRSEFEKAFQQDSTHPLANLFYGEKCFPWMDPYPEDGEEHMENLNKAIYYMERSIEIDPSLAYPHIIIWGAYLMKGDVQRANYHIKELARKNYYPQRVLDYAHNLLVSADSGGIIFTNGDNDTYPLLVLQQGHGFRKDVRVVNTSLLNTSWYAKIMRDSFNVPITYPDSVLDDFVMYWYRENGEFVLPALIYIGHIAENAVKFENGPPVYFSRTLTQSFTEKYRKNLCIEGTLSRYYPDSVPWIDANKLVENLTRKYVIRDYGKGVEWEANFSPITRTNRNMEAIYIPLYVDAARCFAYNDLQYFAVEYFRRAFEIAEKADPELIEYVIRIWLKLYPDDAEALRLKKKYKVHD